MTAFRPAGFWPVQDRSIGSENHELNEQLLEHIEKKLPAASAAVQWNMNWFAAQIGIADDTFRERSIAQGKRVGLYMDYPAPKGCPGGAVRSISIHVLNLWLNGAKHRPV